MAGARHTDVVECLIVDLREQVAVDLIVVKWSA